MMYWRRLEKHILPVFGKMDITAIRPKQILDLLQSLAETGIKDTIRRLRIYMSMIFRYGIIAEYCEVDPAASLLGALPKTISKPLPARVEPQAVKKLFKACCYYGASQTVRNALLFQALTAIRPGNAQKAEWSEVDFSNGIWTIEEGKMKKRRQFKIPLSKAALEVLENQKGITGGRRYIFSARLDGKPISKNTLNQALKSMGITDHVPHG